METMVCRFACTLYDNSTAEAIADYVGTSDWRLPIITTTTTNTGKLCNIMISPAGMKFPPMPKQSPKKLPELFTTPNPIVSYYSIRTPRYRANILQLGTSTINETFRAAVEDPRAGRLE